MNALVPTTNAYVAMWLEAKKNWRPRAPWVEWHGMKEVHCGEVWCDIAPELLAKWAGEREYDSWAAVLGQIVHAR